MEAHAPPTIFGVTLPRDFRKKFAKPFDSLVSIHAKLSQDKVSPKMREGEHRKVNSTEFRRPGPLKSDDEPTQKVRCPIHGFIRDSRNERKIIDHPVFRRLRAIRQLALTSYIYPGATHTRFEHSLGVMEVVTRAFESICSRHGATLERHFGEYPRFRYMGSDGWCYGIDHWRTADCSSNVYQDSRCFVPGYGPGV